MGHWQKEIPAQDGQYWIATRDGLSAGIAKVVSKRGPSGWRQFLAAGPPAACCVWIGWWYSDPIVAPEPPHPKAWEDFPNPPQTGRMTFVRCAQCGCVDGDHVYSCPEEPAPDAA